MWIESLKIYGYGKFVDEEFHIDPEFQVFYGLNESGKTTLYDFIEQILFGFPDRRHMEKRHEPKESSNYGGRLLLRDEQYGQVSVERKGKELSAGEVVLRFEDGSTGGQEDLDILLREMDLAFYQSIYSVNLEALQNISELTEPKLNRLLISVTSLGSERFIDLAESYENRAQQMYTPESKTREIDGILDRMDHLQEEIKKAQSLNDSYLKLYNDIEEIIERQKERENRLTEQTQRIEELEKLLDKVDQYEDYKKIDEELKEKMKKFTPVRAADKRRFDSLKERENRAKADLEKLKRQKSQVQEYRHLPDELVKYQENEEQWDDIFNAMDEAVNILEEERKLSQSENTLARDIERDKDRLGISEDNENLRDFDNSETKEIDIIKKRFQDLTEEKNKEEAHKMSLHVQAENLEEEIEKYSSKTEEETEESGSSLLNGVTLIAGISILLFVILSSPFRYLFLLMALILLGLSVYSYVQKSNENTSQTLARESIEKNIREKQSQYEAVRGEIAQTEMKIEQLEGLLEEENIQWAYLKEGAGINNQWTIEEYKTYEAYYTDLISNIERLERYSYNKQKTANRLEKQMKIIEPIKEEIDMSAPVEKIIEQVKSLQQLINRQKENATEAVQSVGYIQRDINNKTNEIDEIERNLKGFYRDFQAGNAEEFLEIYELTANLKEKEEMHNQLYEKLKPYLEEFTRIDSPEDWKKEILNLDHEIDLLYKEKEQDDNLRTDKRAQMQRIEQGGELPDLIQQYEDERAVLQEKVDERTTYQVAAEIIKRVLKHTNEDASPKLLEFANRIFTSLTGENYSGIHLEDGRVELVRKDKEVFKAHELSTGTKEQLYMSLKLAFLKMMTERFSLPLLIDDGFVNFDENRKREIIQILKQFSKDNQIIYFTFDDTGIDTLRSDQVTML